jgi:acetolactate synthase-1/2/3 large subunit
VTAWRRRDSFPNDHPSFVGMTGLAAPATVRALVADADLLLVIGSRLSEITTWGYSLPAVTTSVIQVDLEPRFRGDRRQPDVAIAADAGPFLRLAAERQAARDGETQGRRGRQRRVASARAAYLAATALPEWQPSSPVHPAAVVAALRGSLPDDAIITTDAGNFSGWAARYLPLPAEARFLGPTSGAMGYAIPAAIGAAAAGNGRRAVALVGDGGFAMSMAELETAVRIGVPLSVIVFDNGMYGTIRMHQEQAHPGRVSATSLGPIDAAAVARASGAQAWTVAADVDVAPAVDAALASAEVSVVHVLVDPRYLSVDRLL